MAKAGRTHLMDAVPVTLGQEFGGYAAQVREGYARIEATLERLGKIPLGGTAVGTGLNTHPLFAAQVRDRLSADTGLEILPPADPFEAQANRDGLVEASAALKGLAVSLTKIANDLRWMGSGPRAGLAEIFIPELQKGSSIMPGKVNPVIPEVVCQVSAQVIGNDTAITVGGLQGSFELNVQIPLMARNLLQSVALLSSTCRLFAEKCVDGIEANREVCERHGEATLAMATALNPYIGYDRATAIVKDAAASGRTLREVALEHGVDAETLDKALDLRAMARGSSRADVKRRLANSPPYTITPTSTTISTASGIARLPLRTSCTPSPGSGGGYIGSSPMAMRCATACASSARTSSVTISASSPICAAISSSPVPASRSAMNRRT